MSATTIPDFPRDPRLSETALRRALDELDAKIKTLYNRAHATVSGSPNTYHAHAVALEAKRVRLAEQLNHSPASASGPEPSVWTQIRQGIETLGDDVKAVL